MDNNNFKQKRIDYLNNWPNVVPFEIEEQYCKKVEEIKELENTIFVPYPLKYEENADYNKAVSFMIEAVEELEKYPNHAFEFMFKSYDTFSKIIYSDNITDRNRRLCDNKWSLIITSNNKLNDAICLLLESIPMKACQYIYSRMCNRHSKAYNRVVKEIGGMIDNTNRKNIIESIENKYGYDFNNYSESIRLASALYRIMLKNREIDVNNSKYSVSMCDKLHFIISGYIYTLRNDTMHGSTISITKSSKANMSTYANNYYAFMFLYYLVNILILDEYSSDYNINKYDELADNIKQNIKLYKLIFGNHIGK